MDMYKFAIFAPPFQTLNRKARKEFAKIAKPLFVVFDLHEDRERLIALRSK